MKRLLATLLICMLGACAHDNYTVPYGSNLSNDPQEIKKQRILCQQEGLDSFHSQYGYVLPALGAVVGGAVAGPIGGAAGGAVYGGQDEVGYINNYQITCMKSKGYVKVSNN